jgi:hypothetical protein
MIRVSQPPEENSSINTVSLALSPIMVPSLLPRFSPSAQRDLPSSDVPVYPWPLFVIIISFSFSSFSPIPSNKTLPSTPQFNLLISPHNILEPTGGMFGWI